MKMLCLLGLSLLSALPAIAQDAHESSVRFKKEDRSGVVAAYDAPKDVVEAALEAKLQSIRLGKRHKESGYWKFEGVSWPEISANKMDVYFDIERHKGKSEITMLVSPGNGNFVTTATDPQIVEGMKAFLTRFNADVISWQQQMAINEQQKALEEANRDLKRADRETDRAARRQKRADRDKERKEKEVNEENKKLQELQKSK